MPESFAEFINSRQRCELIAIYELLECACEDMSKVAHPRAAHGFATQADKPRKEFFMIDYDLKIMAAIATATGRLNRIEKSIDDISTTLKIERASQPLEHGKIGDRDFLYEMAVIVSGLPYEIFNNWKDF